MYSSSTPRALHLSMVSSNSLASSMKAKKDKVKDLNGATMKRRRNVSSYTSDTADIADQA